MLLILFFYLSSSSSFFLKFIFICILISNFTRLFMTASIKEPETGYANHKNRALCVVFVQRLATDAIRNTCL